MDKQLPILIEKTRLINWPFWSGVVFFILVVVGLVKLSFSVSEWLSQDGDAPVDEIIIMGQRHYVADEDISAVIPKAQLASLFNLDVSLVQKSIESLPWVYSASIRKQWPGKLHIYVVEQEPVAVWNSDLMLNKYSEVFMAPTERVAQELPKIFGPAGSEALAWREYKGVNALLNINEFEIKELFLSERYAWQILLTNGIHLNLGQKELVERVQWFIDLYPIIQKHNEKKIEAVDLRYDTGLAVRWQSAEESVQKS